MHICNINRRIIHKCTWSAQLIHKHSRTSLAHHSYFHRLVRIWNSLPPIDLSLSFLTIKTQLIKILWCNLLSYFDPSHPCSFHVICPCCKCSQIPVKSILLNMVVIFYFFWVSIEHVDIPSVQQVSLLPHKFTVILLNYLLCKITIELN